MDAFVGRRPQTEVIDRSLPQESWTNVLEHLPDGVFMVAGAGNLLGGWLCAVLLARGWTVTIARKTSVTFFALWMLSAIPAVLVDDVRISIGLIAIAMAGYTGALAVTLAFPSDVFPKSLVGTIWGLASMGAGFGGMVFTLITGWVVDHYSYVPVFIGFGILPLICATVVWTLLGPLEKEPSLIVTP